MDGSLVEKDLPDLADCKLFMSQYYSFVAKKSNVILDCLKRGITLRNRI